MSCCVVPHYTGLSRKVRAYIVTTVTEGPDRDGRSLRSGWSNSGRLDSALTESKHVLAGKNKSLCSLRGQRSVAGGFAQYYLDNVHGSNYSHNSGVVCRYGMVWYGMVWYGMVWYGVVWYGLVCRGGSRVLIRVFSTMKGLEISWGDRPGDTEGVAGAEC